MEKPLPALTALLGIPVVQHPTSTGGAKGIIRLEPKYAKLLEPMIFQRWQRRRQAQAIYFLLHELRHTRQDIWYKYPEHEDDANRFAADKFRAFVRQRLKFTPQQTHALWSRLPPEYRRPMGVAKTQR